MAQEMARLAMHRYEHPGLQPVIEKLELVLARMARCVDQRLIRSDHIDAETRQVVLNSTHRLLIAGNGFRREDDEIALIERDGRMIVLGDAGDGGARLALT